MTRAFPILGLAGLAALAVLGGCMQTGKDPPKNMPAYARLYPGSQNVMSLVIGPETSDMMTTSDSPDQVIAYYRAQAAADGLPEAQSPTPPPSAGDQKASFYDQPSGRMLVVIAKPHDDSHGGLTLVDITYPTPKAPA
jgi:hypothetical protein